MQLLIFSLKYLNFSEVLSLKSGLFNQKNHRAKKSKGSTVGKNRKYNPNLGNISILDIRFANIENRRINSERERIEGRTTGKKRGKTCIFTLIYTLKHVVYLC